MRSLLLLLAVGGLLSAQPRPEFWPGVTYDPAVPTFQKVLGYQPGERISSHANMLKYLEALQAYAPSRLKIFDYGTTWEGRRLVYAAVGSEATLRRLDAIKAGMQKLRDPRVTPEAEAKPLVAGLPAVVWLGYGVHGNEISSTDAALLTAYHLLAARNDKIVADILANVLLLIDPLQNPDGRDRFVRNFEQAEGLEADASPLAAEHNEPWPTGRVNHYHFDMNRDWFAMTQPETIGRVRALRQWLPVVFVDLHEMGSNSTYYFAPEAVPFNPHLAKDQRDALDWFGRNNAQWFDQYGFNYFTREVYDAFYPGYGASWPSYYGSVAMTYEQASTRGLVWRRPDDSTFTYRDTVRQHFVASVSTCQAAATNRQRLLDNFYRYQQSAIAEGGQDAVREYVIPRQGNTTNVDKLVRLLVEQGAEVRRAPDGTYHVPLAQPAKRFLRTLMDADTPLEPEFLKEQERRRQRRLPDEIYDVTAWSLPLLYNVEVKSAATAASSQFPLVTLDSLNPANVTVPKATVAYLVPAGTSAAARFLAGALRADLKVLSADKAFVQNGRTFPRGTLILRAADNPPNLADAVTRLAKASGAEVAGTDTGWVDSGINFGSAYTFRLRKPVVAMAWDQPTSSLSAGHARYVIERQFNYPVTVVRTQQLATADLSKFDVLILPDGGLGAGYMGVLGANGGRRLKDWVAAGGTLISVGEATNFLANPQVALLATALESQARAVEPPKPPAPLPDGRAPGRLLTSEADYEKAIQPDTEPPDVVAGVLVRAKLDPDHWLTAGAGETVHALVSGRAIYAPLKVDKGVNAATFLGPDQLLAGGFLWEANRRQLAYKPFVMVQREGRGHVIGFTADPNYRAYMDGLNVLFMNAVFRGPAHSR